MAAAGGGRSRGTHLPMFCLPPPDADGRPPPPPPPLPPPPGGLRLLPAGCEAAAVCLRDMAEGRGPGPALRERRAGALLCVSVPLSLSPLSRSRPRLLPNSAGRRERSAARRDPRAERRGGRKEGGGSAERRNGRAGKAGGARRREPCGRGAREGSGEHGARRGGSGAKRGLFTGSRKERGGTAARLKGRRRGSGGHVRRRRTAPGPALCVGPLPPRSAPSAARGRALLRGAAPPARCGLVVEEREEEGVGGEPWLRCGSGTCGD